LYEFLEEISRQYEIIVFTASSKGYADAILDYIDKDNKWIHHRLYREHCVEYARDFYIKDLRVLGRDLKNVIIVDNAPYSFAFQLENGYPIIPYSDDKEDKELKVLKEYLEELRGLDDIRTAIDFKFKTKSLCELNIEQYAQYYRRDSRSETPTSGMKHEILNLETSFQEFFKKDK